MRNEELSSQELQPLNITVLASLSLGYRCLLVLVAGLNTAKAQLSQLQIAASHVRVVIVGISRLGNIHLIRHKENIQKFSSSSCLHHSMCRK